MRRLVQELRFGIKVSTLYGLTTIPSPSANTLIFHRDQTRKRFITLQAQTNLIEGVISEEEIKNILDVVAENAMIPSEVCLINTYKYMKYILLFFAILMLPLPMIIAGFAGGIGLIIATVVYLILLVVISYVKYIR